MGFLKVGVPQSGGKFTRADPSSPDRFQQLQSKSAGPASENMRFINTAEEIPCLFINTPPSCKNTGNFPRAWNSLNCLETKNLIGFHLNLKFH